MNRYPIHGQHQRWQAKISPLLFRLTRSFRARMMRKTQRLVEVELRGVEVVRDAIARGAGILITPNHPGHADAFCMNAAGDAIGGPFYYMTAWQVLAEKSWIGQWMLQKHGCFSVDREGVDREAFRTAVDVLQTKKQPLVVFPEGEVYHQNDRVTPFREGAAAMAILAAKRAEREVVCIPCAIKYRYVDDPMPGLLSLMGELEEKILWRPRRDLEMRSRVYRLANGLIALKEIEYLGSARGDEEGETLTARIDYLADHILRTLEGRYELKSPSDGGNGGGGIDRTTPERVKAVRAAALAQLQALADDDEGATGDSAALEERIARDLDDVFLVVQLFSYPGDYLREDAPIERLAETLDKFEEDVLGHTTATIRARRRGVVSFGEAILVGGEEKFKAGALTGRLEGAVQGLLDGIE